MSTKNKMSESVPLIVGNGRPVTSDNYNQKKKKMDAEKGSNPLMWLQ